MKSHFSIYFIMFRLRSCLCGVAGAQHLRYSHPRHGTCSTPVIQHCITKLILPNALANHSFDLSASNACRQFRQFCGDRLLEIVRGLTGQCTRKTCRPTQ
ncbi:hypothetical protein [Aeromonas hydrophila]|uniref:Secreted protein n=1 Tax=Aeromonas hydrophila TaxID=644 RepID=A0AAX3P6E4_AERHY|nr:hypothetical protein [Aeromonas hydrophila]WEE26208.1 hypothetical protein PY771_21745 [Aeromonas hydrophila]